MNEKIPTIDPTTDEMISDFTIEEIVRQHQRIIASNEFHATESQRKLFDFVLQQVFAGESDQLKGYTIATQIFGRNQDFDQNTDPIVSIHANKLRRALERYYLTAGSNDLLRIDIPKGTYVPVFFKHNRSNVPTTKESELKPVISDQDSWPTVLVKPFKNMTGDSDSDYFLLGLATELSVALSRYQDIRVLMYNPEGENKRASDSPARFLVEGSVHREETNITVNVYLIDSAKNVQFFGDTQKTSIEPSRIIASQEELTEKIALTIAGEHGGISRTMAREARAKPPIQTTTYEAILRYNEYDRFFNEDTYIKALEAVTHASITEPDCGQIWTLMGRLHADSIVHEFFDTDTTLEQALSYAVKGVIMNPNDQRARYILAFIRLFCGEISAAKAEAERALALNPVSLFYMDAIGYALTLLGEWERGTMLIKKALSLNPYNHNFVYYAFWLNHFRMKEYEAAYIETMNLTIIENFWAPLARAATLGQLGRIKEGEVAARELLTLKPDFKTRGCKLIRYFIKFDEIIDRVVDGLGKVGVVVE